MTRNPGASTIFIKRHFGIGAIKTDTKQIEKIAASSIVFVPEAEEEATAENGDVFFNRFHLGNASRSTGNIFHPA
jgi:hypothetical protein